MHTRWYDGSILAKVCTSCDELKLMADFSKDRSRADGKQPHCKACNTSRREADKDARKAWWKDNPDKYRAYKRAYKTKLLSRTDEQVLQDQRRLHPYGMKACRYGHAEKVTHFSVSKARSDGLQPECKLHANLRLVKSAIDVWEDLDLWSCIRCGAEFEHVDHSLPQSRIDEFGAEAVHHPENLKPMCGLCNMEKNARTMAERWPSEHKNIRTQVQNTQKRGEST